MEDRKLGGEGAQTEKFLNDFLLYIKVQDVDSPIFSFETELNGVWFKPVDRNLTLKIDTNFEWNDVGINPFPSPLIELELFWCCFARSYSETRTVCELNRLLLILGHHEKVMLCQVIQCVESQVIGPYQFMRFKRKNIHLAGMSHQIHVMKYFIEY